MPVTESALRVALKNILMATDFSKTSEMAMDYAISLTQRYHACLDIVHVVDPETYFQIPLDNGGVFSLDDTKRVLGSRLEDLATRLGGNGIVTHAVVAEGRVGHAIHQLAAKRKSDLVVVGTHGGGTMERLMLGSKAEEIFREVPCPVLTVGPGVYRHPESEIRFKHILYATDFTHDVNHAALALSLAEQDHADLTLLHVITGDMVSQSQLERHASHCRHELRKLVSEDSERRYHTVFRVEHGSAGSVITQFANERGVDLIVLGAKKSSFVASRLVSGTAYQVVAHANCPVLTIRTR